jgi:hypothetical protein
MKGKYKLVRQKDGKAYMRSRPRSSTVKSMAEFGKKIDKVKKKLKSDSKNMNKLVY